MKNGDVVFFKKAKTGSHRRSPEVQFKGYAFGLLLGHVPPFGKDPPADHLLRLMGSIGFLSFDDVGEFLGTDAGAEVLKKFEDKYYGKVVDPNAPKQEELPMPEPSKLVDAGGAPIVSETPQLSEVPPHDENAH